MPLAKNVTIADLLGEDLLEDPDAFMLRIYSSLKKCVQAHGEAYVRLGIRSKGPGPNGKIKKASWPNHLIVYDEAGSEHEFGRFDTVHLNDFKGTERHDENWSSERTSLSEFEEVFKKLPGRTVTRKKSST